mmetsp:Transcript_86132/g.180161  ORF Transcript_86132/g.180161 Transcript_86132/m.180161 type:complete len:538 (+) Transcript_86132:98-1711(+)
MSCFLWIRCESLDHVVFNTSVKWTDIKVQDFIASLKSSVPSSLVTKETWVEAATQRCKPALSEVEAVAYWHIFLVLSQSLYNQGPSVDRLDVRAIGLLMMCQVFCSQRVRTDQYTMSGEIWPALERASAAPSPRSSPRNGSPRGSSPRVGVGAAGAQTSVQRVKESSTAMLAFVRQHFSIFLEAVCSASSSENATITSEEFDILGHILCGGPSFRQPCARLSEAVPELPQGGSILCRDLKRLVERSLAWNEELYPLVEASTGNQVQTGPVKSVVVSGLAKTTWFQRPEGEDIDILNISHCNDCNIYVTGHVRYCFIAGCHDCTIVLPAVSSVCTLQNCEKITIHCVARCFKMENSIDSSAFVYCLNPPILTGDSRGIKLAPFNALYSGLRRALARANMKLEEEHVDVWAHPVCCTLGTPDETLGGRSGNLDEAPGNTTYHFVHPDNFQPIVLPEDQPQTAVAAARVALVLPQVYDDALKAREDEIRAFQSLVAELGDDTKKRRAHQAIQGHFREWLQASGKSRQLADLAKLAQQESR